MQCQGYLLQVSDISIVWFSHVTWHETMLRTVLKGNLESGGLVAREKKTGLQM